MTDKKVLKKMVEVGIILPKDEGTTIPIGYKNFYKDMIREEFEEKYGKRKKAGMAYDYNPVILPLEDCFN